MDKYSFLNETEKELLTYLQDDKATLDALKKLMMNSIYEQGVVKSGAMHDPLHNWALSLATRDVSNEQLGSDLRAAAQGILFVQIAFKDLANFKPEVEKVEKSNPAR